MKQEIGNRAGEAAAWHNLAAIDVHEGAYAPAREKFERSLKIEQEIGKRDGEAATWHNLATIDLEEGAYAPAREKFERALKMKQEIGNRAGEAATFYQLGILAAKLGKPETSLPLIALCFMIDQAIGHGDTEQDGRNLTALSSSLNFKQEQFDAMMQQTAESYAQDRGASLLRQAFPEEPQPPE